MRVLELENSEGTPGRPVVPAYPHISLKTWRQFSVLERIAMMHLWIENNNLGAENENPSPCGPSDPANDPPGGS